jgi:hypothetical protein
VETRDTIENEDSALRGIGWLVEFLTELDTHVATPALVLGSSSPDSAKTPLAISIDITLRSEQPR